MRLVRQGKSFSGRERNCVFLNARGPRFANLSAVSGLDFADDGRALAVTDWDQDGDLDLWLSNRTGPRLRLMRNDVARADAASSGFVSIRLEGRQSNRDAVGARVELHLKDDSVRPMIQTLRAGDAFLSQSSKWLHFGLRDSKPDHISVRWPAGQTERFPLASDSQRYHLVEGAGRAVPVAIERTTSKLVPTTQPAPSGTRGTRTYLSNRVPLPLLVFESREGESHQLGGPRDRPLLINFWASWCEPCISELTGWTQDGQAFRDAGIDVLAISVDGLDEQAVTTREDAWQALEQRQVTLPAGVATRSMLEKLEIVSQIIFNRQSGLVIPSSLLIDVDATIGVVYRGPVKTSTIARDASLLERPVHQRRDLAVPFKGRWASPPRELRLSAVARLFRDRGYVDDYLHYLEKEVAYQERLFQHQASVPQRLTLSKELAAAHLRLGTELASTDQTKSAISHFQRVLEIEPSRFEAYINLGALLAKDQQMDASIDVLQKAIEIDPESAPARINLGAALASQDNFQAAIDQYRQLLDRHPNLAVAHAQLGSWLLTTRQFGQAVTHLESAVRMNPRDSKSRLRLSWLLATSPHATWRNGRRAVELMEPLYQKNAGQDAIVLDVLAAAYAEEGTFSRATELGERALQNLENERQGLRTEIQRRLMGYRNGQPHRDEDGTYP